jgi:dTDP-4-dehydrorhamnose reductase
VVNNQVGAPTYTMDLAEKLEQIAMRGNQGLGLLPPWQDALIRYLLREAQAQG